MRRVVSTARINLGSVSEGVTHHSRRQGSRLITGPRSEETSCACRFCGLRAVALTHSTLAGYVVDDVGAAFLFAVLARAVKAARQERKAGSGGNEDAQHGSTARGANFASLRLTGEDALL